MWLYIIYNFPRSKQGKSERLQFEHLLSKDGFNRIFPGIFIRHCTSLGNAQQHKERVKDYMFVKSNVSILFVADTQNEYAYHYLDALRNKKSAKNALKKRELIEFL